MCVQHGTYNLYELFLEQAQKYPRDIVLFYNDRPITYSEALQDIQKISSFLHTHGIQKNTTVIIQEGNTPYFVYCFFATLQCNALPVLVNPLARQYELKYYIDVTNPMCIITNNEMAKRLFEYGIISDKKKL